MNLKNKKVMVTGADGFIGSHLTEMLLEHAAKVKAFVYYNSFNSRGWLDYLQKDKIDAIDFFAGDIRDPNGVKTAMKDVDVVFHLAALIAIPFSYHSPDSYVDTNIKGTLNVLQAARDSNCEKLIVTSTSEVYGTAQYVPIDEKHPFQGQSPYSATKIGADRLAEAFYRSFALPLTIVRPFNTYGPRQSARAIIPTVITQALNNKDIHIGNPNPTRDFVFTDDTCRGFLEIAASDKTIGEEINIASAKEISIGKLVDLIKNKINPDLNVISDKERLRPDNSEVERLLGSNDKLFKLTGWKPEVTIEQGLAKTIEWFSDKNNLKQYKADIYNI